MLKESQTEDGKDISETVEKDHIEKPDSLQDDVTGPKGQDISDPTPEDLHDTKPTKIETPAPSEVQKEDQQTESENKKDPEHPKEDDKQDPSATLQKKSKAEYHSDVTLGEGKSQSDSGEGEGESEPSREDLSAKGGAALAPQPPAQNEIPLSKNPVTESEKIQETLSEGKKSEHPEREVSNEDSTSVQEAAQVEPPKTETQKVETEESKKEETGDSLPQNDPKQKHSVVVKEPVVEPKKNSPVKSAKKSSDGTATPHFGKSPVKETEVEKNGKALTEKEKNQDQSLHSREPSNSDYIVEGLQESKFQKDEKASNQAKKPELVEDHKDVGQPDSKKEIINKEISQEVVHQVVEDIICKTEAKNSQQEPSHNFEFENAD